MTSVCAAIDQVKIPKSEPIKEDRRIQADLKRLAVYMNIVIEEEEINETKYKKLASELNNVSIVTYKMIDCFSFRALHLFW